MRLFAATIVATATIGAVFVACGSSSSSKPDAKVYKDGKVYLDGSGSGSSTPGLGEPCTAGSGSGFTQGSCPASFVCVGGLTGEHGAFCSKTCTAGSGDMCNTGYTGHGLGACIFAITVGSGSAAMDYCGVVCEGSAISCPPATCDGMCQGSETCSAALMNGSGSTVAHACF